MEAWAIIEDGICVNVIVSDESFAERLGAVPLPGGYGIGDSFDGENWVRNAVPEESTDGDVATISEKAAAYDILTGASE